MRILVCLTNIKIRAQPLYSGDEARNIDVEYEGESSEEPSVGTDDGNDDTQSPSGERRTQKSRIAAVLKDTEDNQEIVLCRKGGKGLGVSKRMHLS